MCKGITLLLAALLLSDANNVLAQQKQVVWLQTDWAPHQIVDGPLAGQGTFDVLQTRLSRLLPHYQHEIQLTSLGRIEPLLLSTHITVCVIGSSFTEQRAATRYYSLPIAIGSGFAINYVTGSKVANIVREQPYIDLTNIALNQQLLGAYQPNRYYPDVISAVIQHPEATLLANEFSSGLNVAALLTSGRLDYVIEYPERIQFFQRAITTVPAIVSAAISGTEFFSLRYVTCNKTTLGERVINDINQLLPALWQADDYAEVLFSWLDQQARALLMPKFEEVRQDMAKKNRP